MELSGPGFKSYSSQLSIATSKNPSVVNTICMCSFRCTHLIICASFPLKQMWRLTKAIVEMKREHWTKISNWSNCTKFAAVSASWTHCLIAQWVTGLWTEFSGIHIYICTYIYICVCIYIYTYIHIYIYRPIWKEVPFVSAKLFIFYRSFVCSLFKFAATYFLCVKCSVFIQQFSEFL